jgi:hypothetical protein
VNTTIQKISYAALTASDKQEIASRLDTRKQIYTAILNNQLETVEVLLVGDRPGPSAPKDELYVHTPFLSVKHCSGWLNALLHANSIPERRLAWINSSDRIGTPLNFDIVRKLRPTRILALGGNAERWLVKNGCASYIKIDHPQYWKRFKNSQPYPLVDVLKTLLHN